MKNLLKHATLALTLTLGVPAMAAVNWKPYSAEAVAQAEKSGKAVLLGFHKQGCGTCSVQDEVLEEAGINENSNIVAFKVERKDKALAPVYEQHGLNRQWSVLVLKKNGKEIARVDPGVTDEAKIKDLVAKAK